MPCCACCHASLREDVGRCDVCHAIAVHCFERLHTGELLRPEMTLDTGTPTDAGRACDACGGSLSVTSACITYTVSDRRFAVHRGRCLEVLLSV